VCYVDVFVALVFCCLEEASQGEEASRRAASGAAAVVRQRFSGFGSGQSPLAIGFWRRLIATSDGLISYRVICLVWTGLVSGCGSPTFFEIRVDDDYGSVSVFARTPATVIA
jgi:hypothetical protein